MPFHFLSIKGFLGNGAFWLTVGGHGFIFRDVSVNKFTYDESKLTWKHLYHDTYFYLF